ncbi:MAG TPA: hypothetical protein DEP84_34410 [Chloroflexi bacterium]|nr:hypothetical protein [Chloroflexota bacterium]
MRTRHERTWALRQRRRFAQALLRIGLRALIKLDLRCQTPIPPGPLVIAANHLSHLDPLLLITILDRPPECAALSDLWHALVAPFIWLYAPIAVQRDQADRHVIAQVLAALAAGERVIIFPEARISNTSGLTPARSGVGYLALKTGVPVLPVAIYGTERAPQAWHRLRRAAVRITIGAPLRLSHTPQPRREDRAAATAAIMHRIAALLPPVYRGVYSSL